MQLPGSEYALWIIGTALRILLCIMILRHRTYRQIPFFSAFVLFAVFRSLLLWWVYHDPRIEDGIEFNTYWLTQLVLVTGRGLAVVEICWLTLRAHRGVWALAWRLLAAVGTCLLVFAVIAGIEELHRVSPFVLRVERGLELGVIALLITLFAVCRYYGVQADPLVKYVAIGLGLHAAIQAMNNTAFYSTRVASWWAITRTMSFNVSLLVWCWALGKPMLLPDRPNDSTAAAYDQLAPEVNFRLRQLNHRLLEMLK
jgi:hypothetical protein